jgi:uncharacterized surface protein with fasciclin (FAS1) repeats
MKGKSATVIALKDILNAVREAGSFTMFIKAVEAAGLEKVVQGSGPLTIFAPVDRAFDALPKATWDRLLNNPKELNDILTYHMVAGKLTIGTIMTMTGADTLLGPKLRINGCDGLTINNAKVIKADVDASNGIVHGIDKVLKIPPR